MMLAVLLCSVTTVVARDSVTRDVNVLPAKAQAFLKSNFKKGVNHIKVDSKALGGKEYDVILNDGTEVEFNKEGSWESVDCGSSAVPSAIVPKMIRDYVSKNYKGQKIVEISVDRRGYEVQLYNGRELKFDRAGNFKRVDD